MNEALILATNEALILKKQTIGVLAEIRDELKRIADSLPIPFVPVSTLEEQRDENFRTALKLVRYILDGKGDDWLMTGPVRSCLHDVEALLSCELGEPVWEGHPTPEADAAASAKERRRP